MNLTNLEKETIILFNEAEKEAEVFTYNSRLKKQIGTLCEKFPNEFKQVKDNGDGGLTFIVPKRRIQFSRPRPQAKINFKN